MQISDQLGRYSYLDNWFHSWLASTQWLQTFESMFQGGARGRGFHMPLYSDQYGQTLGWQKLKMIYNIEHFGLIFGIVLEHACIHLKKK